MPLTREERKLLHQKSKQPTFGSGKPDKTFGEEGDVAYRKVSDAGTVQYIKQDGDWVALSSSGDKPESRTQTVTRTIISGGGGGGVTNHGNLNGLSDDDHSQYVLVNGTRAFSGNWTNASHTIADLGTVTTADINGGNIDGMTIATSDITVGTGKTLDVSAGTLTLGANQISGDSINNGTIDSITIDQLAGPLDANSQAITNINIDSGAIDGVTIGANSANTGVFTTLTATTLGGALNVNNENLTNVDIDSGTIDNTDITVGTGKTLNVSAGTFTTSAAQNKVIIEGAASNLDIGNFNFTLGNTLQAGTVIADDLTAGRVVFSTGSGQLTDDSDFTFATDTLTVTKIGAFELTGKITAGSSEIEGSAFDINGGTVDGITSLTVANDVDIGNFKLESKALEASDLTETRVTFAGVDGLLTDSNDFKFITDTLNVTKIGAYTLTGKLTGGASEIEGSNFDIDGGTIDAVTIGTNSVATQIKVDNLDLNGSTIESSSGGLNLTTTGSGDITLDIVSGNLIISKDGDSPTQTLISVDDQDGKFTIDTEDSGDIVLKPAGGQVYVHDGTNNIIELDGANPSITIKDDTTPADNFKIDVGAKAATTISTVDSTGALGHLTFDVNGNIVLDASAGNTQLELNGTAYGGFKLNSNIIEFDSLLGDFVLDSEANITLDANTGSIALKRNGVAYGSFELDGAGPDIELDISSGSFTVDAAGDIILDAAGDDIKFKDGGTERFRMDLETAPVLAVTGDFTLDGSASITIDGTTGVSINENGQEVIHVDTNRIIHFNDYTQTGIYNMYGWNNQASKYHFTSGSADFQENLSVISMFEQNTTSVTYPV